MCFCYIPRRSWRPFVLFVCHFVTLRSDDSEINYIGYRCVSLSYPSSPRFMCTAGSRHCPRREMRKSAWRAEVSPPDQRDNLCLWCHSVLVFSACASLLYALPNSCGIDFEIFSFIKFLIRHCWRESLLEILSFFEIPCALYSDCSCRTKLHWLHK